MTSNPEIVAELRRLSAKSKGVLMPQSVVEAARKKTSPLHSCFEWDDSRAAEGYRVQQARQLLRVTVEWVTTGETRKPIEVFVSLSSDRKEGGYRETLAVLTSTDLRQQLLADALDELSRVQKKYADLTELADVFAAVRKLQQA